MTFLVQKEGGKLLKIYAPLLGKEGEGMEPSSSVSAAFDSK